MYVVLLYAWDSDGIWWNKYGANTKKTSHKIISIYVIFEYFFFNKNKSVNIAIDKNKYLKQLYEVIISLSYWFIFIEKKSKFSNIPLAKKK